MKPNRKICHYRSSHRDEVGQTCLAKRRDRLKQAAHAALDGDGGEAAIAENQALPAARVQKVFGERPALDTKLSCSFCDPNIAMPGLHLRDDVSPARGRRDG